MATKKYLDDNGLVHFWHKIKQFVAGAVPTKTSDLTNDSGFITAEDVPEGASPSGTSPKMDGTAAVGTETAFARGDHRHPSDTSKQDTISDLATIRSGAAAGATAYQKPSGGIPETDLASAVQTSLGKADSALQSHQDISGLAPKASPALTGTPTAPTATAGTSTTQIATTAFVANAVSTAVGSLYKVKGTKATYANLPSSGNVTGDVWNVEAAYGNYPPGTNWVWTGTTWDALGGTIDLSSYLTSSEAASTYLKLSGGTMTGQLKWKDTVALPRASSATNVLTIDTFASGGATKWADISTLKASLGLSGNVGSADKPIYLNSGAPTQVSSLDGSLVGGYVGYSQDGFLVTHPEAAKGIIVPYLYNDIAFLMSRGGSCSVYSTTDTDLTADVLAVKTDWNSLPYKENMFDASPSYYSPGNGYAQEMNADGLIIDLELPRLFTYGNKFYIDFGNSSFGFDNIDILVKNSNTETNYVSKVSGGSTNNKSEYFAPLSHSSSSGGSTVSGFNRLRIHLYGRSNTAGVRIAQIGLIQYNSIGHRYPMMSRGFDDGVWRNISPATTNTYSLGNANSRWTNIYSNFGSFGSTANGTSEINISSSTNNIRLLAYSGNTAYIQSGSASNNAGNLTLCGRNGVAGGTLVFNFASTVVSGPFSVREGFSVGTSSNNKNATIYGNAIANSFVKSGGTSSQFLKADGSVDSNTYALASDIPDAQVQSDWNQTTTTAKDYIKNKPNIVNNGNGVVGINNSTFGYGIVNISDSKNSISLNDANGDGILITTNSGNDGRISLTSSSNIELNTSGTNKAYYNNKEIATKNDIPTVDATPTSGSTNAVTSGGVYTALPSALTAEEIQDIWNATIVGLISFTINDVTYQAEAGMTWKEWVDSTYNTGGFYYDGNGTNYGSFVRPQENIESSVREPEGNMSVHATDVIVENLDYCYDISGWGGSND